MCASEPLPTAISQLRKTTCRSTDLNVDLTGVEPEGVVFEAYKNLKVRDGLTTAQQDLLFAA